MDWGDICGVSLKRCDGDQGGDVTVLEHAPDIDIALGWLALVDHTALRGQGSSKRTRDRRKKR